MAAGDPSILAAMDGRETMTAAKINGTVPVRDEPTVFFFVIFGLVYEALASSSAEATSVTSRQPTIIAALQALKSLVKPEYAGKALLEPTTFDEFISLCYRMAMTETATIQVHLIEVLAALASNQDQRSKAAGNLRYHTSLIYSIGLTIRVLVITISPPLLLRLTVFEFVLMCFDTLSLARVVR